MDADLSEQDLYRAIKQCQREQWAQLGPLLVELDFTPLLLRAAHQHAVRAAKASRGLRPLGESLFGAGDIGALSPRTSREALLSGIAEAFAGKAFAEPELAAAALGIEDDASSLSEQNWTTRARMWLEERLLESGPAAKAA